MGVCCSHTNDGGPSRIRPAQAMSSNPYQAGINTVVTGGNKPLKDFATLAWKPESPITRQQLRVMRDGFWHTQPSYSGRQEIWQALQLACDSQSTELAQSIVTAAQITVPTGILSDGCYDVLGNQYVIPLYCFLDPTHFDGEISNVNTSARSAGFSSATETVYGAGGSFMTHDDGNAHYETTTQAVVNLENRISDASRTHSIQAGTVDPGMDPAGASMAANKDSTDKDTPDCSVGVLILSHTDATPASRSTAESVPPSVVQGAVSPTPPVRLPSPSIQETEPCAATGDMIPITVRLSTGPDIKLSICKSDTIAHLKSTVSKRDTHISHLMTETQFFKLRVMYLGKELADTLRICDSRIAPGSVVQIMVLVSS
ncbi:hypothetical protein BASA62_007006 [Batrachochytrium salamandrivorans]|nr:hypothetical protein BASA62_007006 [Batrachochytrium salamandrivorans]